MPVDSLPNEFVAVSQSSDSDAPELLPCPSQEHASTLAQIPCTSQSTGQDESPVENQSVGNAPPVSKVAVEIFTSQPDASESLLCGTSPCPSIVCDELPVKDQSVGNFPSNSSSVNETSKPALVPALPKSRWLTNEEKLAVLQRAREIKTAKKWGKKRRSKK